MPRTPNDATPHELLLLREQAARVPKMIDEIRLLRGRVSAFESAEEGRRLQGDDPRDQRAEIHRLRIENARLRKAEEQARKDFEAERNEHAKTKAALAHEKRKNAADSSNTSTPPSQDPFRKRGRKRGRRVGTLEAAERAKAKAEKAVEEARAGTNRPRMEPTEPDVHFWPAECSCGEPLDGAPEVGKAAVRQMQDIPPPAAVLVTDFHLHACSCPKCGRTVRAEVGRAARKAVGAVLVPSGDAPREIVPVEASAPVRLGPNAAALAAHLVVSQQLPARRAADLMRDACGLRLSANGLLGLAVRSAGDFGEVRDAVEGIVLTARVAGLDETSVKINRRDVWVHAGATPTETLLVLGPGRGDLLPFRGTYAVRDGLVGYNKPLAQASVKSAQCNAHGLRYAERADSDAKAAWADRYVEIVMRGKELADSARKRGVSAHAAFPVEAARVKADLSAALDAGIAWHEAKPAFERPGPPDDGKTRKRGGRTALHPDHNFAVRARRDLDEFLRFMDDPDIPFTNNAAEQALRMLKVKMKISGVFRSERLAKAWCALRTVVETGRKRGWGTPLEILRTPPSELLARLAA